MILFEKVNNSTQIHQEFVPSSSTSNLVTSNQNHHACKTNVELEIVSLPQLSK
jgi:hypothetical protein